MATEFKVVYDLQHGGGGSPAGDGVLAITEAEAKELTKNAAVEKPERFTKPIKVFGQVQIAKVISLETETEAEATKYVKYVMGGEVVGVIPTKASPITNKEAAEKPVNLTTAAEFKPVAAV